MSSFARGAVQSCSCQLVMSMIWATSEKDCSPGGVASKAFTQFWETGFSWAPFFFQFFLHWLKNSSSTACRGAMSSH